jgi:hypothetical protein
VADGRRRGEARLLWADVFGPGLGRLIRESVIWERGRVVGFAQGELSGRMALAREIEEMFPEHKEGIASDDAATNSMQAGPLTQDSAAQPPCPRWNLLLLSSNGGCAGRSSVPHREAARGLRAHRRCHRPGGEAREHRQGVPGLRATADRLRSAATPHPPEVFRGGRGDRSLKSGEIVDALNHKIDLALRYMDDKTMSEASFRDLALGTTAMIEKRQLLRGEPTADHFRRRAREAPRAAAACCIAECSAAA